MSDLLAEPYNPYSGKPAPLPPPEQPVKLHNYTTTPGVNKGYTVINLVLHIRHDIAQSYFDKAGNVEAELRTTLDEKLRASSEFGAFETANRRLDDLQAEHARLKEIIDSTESQLKSNDFPIGELAAMTDKCSSAQQQLTQLAKAQQAAQDAKDRAARTVHGLAVKLADEARREALEEVYRQERRNDLIELAEEELGNLLAVGATRGRIAAPQWAQYAGEALGNVLVGPKMPAPFQVDPPNPLVGLVHPVDPGAAAFAEAAKRAAAVEQAAPGPVVVPMGCIAIGVPEPKPARAPKPPPGANLEAWEASRPSE